MIFWSGISTPAKQFARHFIEVHATTGSFSACVSKIALQRGKLIMNWKQFNKNKRYTEPQNEAASIYKACRELY